MITRRDLIAAGAVVVAQAAVASAADAPVPGSAPAQTLARAALDCVRTGEACLQHCLTLLATGDKTLGECAQMVNQMLAVCRAVGPIVDAGGKYVRPTAQLCRDVCSDCEQVCRQHAQQHTICATCADACAAAVAAAKQVIA